VTMLAELPPTVWLSDGCGGQWSFLELPYSSLQRVKAAGVYAVCSVVHLPLLYGELPFDVVQTTDHNGNPRFLRILYIGVTGDFAERHAPTVHEYERNFVHHNATIALVRGEPNPSERRWIEQNLIGHYNPTINVQHRTV